MIFSRSRKAREIASCVIIHMNRKLLARDLRRRARKIAGIPCHRAPSSSKRFIRLGSTASFGRISAGPAPPVAKKPQVKRHEGIEMFLYQPKR